MAIYHRDGFRCLFCGEKESLSLDHVDPKGGNAPNNLVTLCVECNTKRGTKPYTPDQKLVVDLARSIEIDRAKGLQLAKKKWPERFAKEARRPKRCSRGKISR